MPGAAHVRGTANKGCLHVCAHFSFSSCFLAEAGAQESQDSKTVAVTRAMRYADSRQLLPQRDAAHGECVRAAAKPQCDAACREGCGFRVRAARGRQERASGTAPVEFGVLGRKPLTNCLLYFE